MRLKFLSIISVILFVFITGCTKDNSIKTYQLLEIKGHVQVYLGMPPFYATNATVSINIDGTEEYGITNDKGIAEADSPVIYSVNSINEFPASVSIYAVDNNDSSITGTAKVKIKYKHVDTDGSTEIYKGYYNATLIIKRQ